MYLCRFFEVLPSFIKSATFAFRVGGWEFLKDDLSVSVRARITLLSCYVYLVIATIKLESVARVCSEYLGIVCGICSSTDPSILLSAQ